MAEEEKKAYDPKDLLEKLKDEGLDVAEDAARLVFLKTMEWVKESADISDGIVDDLIVKLIPSVERWVLDKIDEIDGEDDPDPVVN